ncbi:FtsB family cell division protein [Lentilactobacillus kisonensis]|uniref:Septum formation initiator n=2 Tax=Lentilactobacillus kisonensis TaxID=481722 RepID=H1LGN3_9LACO|nr:septum formation initiator family protein [Lentilactobacillus kisonensis]EHO50902.1 septum formation initiator [Lentilactobacillus kisonensis F0435]KRL20297.1 septum formation initiator [Lentilactobacillus kisonensis DSM 19906 = JCM 15041]
MTSKHSKIKKLENDFTRRREIEMDNSQAVAVLSNRRKKRAMFIIGVFAIFVIIFAVQIIRAKVNYADVNVQISRQEKKYHQQKTTNKVLNAKVAQLNDKSYVEKIIRDRYYYTKPGETVYSFPNQAPKDVNDNDAE